MPSNSIKTYNDPVLNEIVKGYTPFGFIRQEVLPDVSVSTLRGDILSGGSEHLRIQNDVINGHSQTPIMTCSITTTDGFKINSHGLKKCITVEDAIE